MLDEMYALEHAWPMKNERLLLGYDIFNLLRTASRWFWATSENTETLLLEDFAGLFSMKRCYRRVRVVLDQPNHCIRVGSNIIALRNLCSVIPLYAPNQVPEWKLLVQDNIELQTWTFGFDSCQLLQNWLGTLGQVMLETNCNDCLLHELVLLSPVNACNRLNH
ncbi:hypothetical protein THRCLA_22357 [Thraustotheca clavata]|uniref:Uncharacterized protein n=1 Tax=Thraustotheca clavata TaxID=74557 RepID=A0A1V9Z4B9_9STRA|nr:hypothetical protein THRCLA_22357 [Thraustotheca clavata]